MALFSLHCRARRGIIKLPAALWRAGKRGGTMHRTQTARTALCGVLGALALWLVNA